jgi:hypothetical protein
MDGVGITGDAIGMAEPYSTTTAGTTPGATRFTTETITTRAEPRATEETAFTAKAEMETALIATGTATAVELTATPTQRQGLSKEIPKLLEDMQNPAVRAASARASSVATTTEEKKRAFPSAAVKASGADLTAADLTAAEGPTAPRIDSRHRTLFTACITWKWRDATCGERN